jgi:hypothetical protein
VHEVLTKLFLSHCIYSSFSNDVGLHKYRVIIPCEYSPEQLPILLDYLFSEFHQSGVMLADVKENRTWSQLWYFPRVPDAGHENLFQFYRLDGVPLDSDTKQQGGLKNNLQPERAEPLPLVPKKPIDESNGRRNPLKEFNQSFCCEDILLRNGYIKKGLKYLRPDSESKIPAVQLCLNCKDGVERVYSHGNDALNDGFAHDAFDCFCLLEHGGDFNKALAWSDEITNHNQRLFMQEQSGSEETAVAEDSHNNILDDNNHYCSVDFLKHVPDSHLLKRLSLSVAKATDMPVHTVFMAGMGVFSSISSRLYRVNYQHGGHLPMGIYTVLEQPPGTSKTWVTSTFQRPFFEVQKEINESLSADEKIILFKTNTTAEALEASLIDSGGYFSAVSSEQGLFNTLLGNCYNGDRINNNDLVLNSFAGEFMSSSRISRAGYMGLVIGNIVLFAQPGSVENLLKASENSGLFERFLLLSEKHNLGRRDFTKTVPIARSLSNEYDAVCKPLCREALSNIRTPEALPCLNISHNGWNMINVYRNSIEKHLADGGKYSHTAIRGAASKINMQIMKIAANLQLFNFNQSGFIDDALVETTIAIADGMLESMLRLCMDKGVIGDKAEFEAILSLFEISKAPRPERIIIQIKSMTKPFKDYTGNKSVKIKNALKEMVDCGLLQVSYSPDKKPVKQYSLA